MKRILSFAGAEERYQSLRLIGFLFTLIGAILLAIGTLLLVLGLYALLSSPTGGSPRGVAPFAAGHGNVMPFVVAAGGGLSLLWSFGAFMSGVQLIALGTLFRLLIHLEENSRVAAQSLDKIRMRLESRGEDAEPLLRI